MRVRHGCDYSMRNKCLALLLFVALVVVGATTRFAIAQEAKLGSAQQTQIESAISKFMATSRAPGISVAVVENGELIWSSGFGFADLENHVAATSATLYRLGSISKPITATGAMQLWERKKLDLDAPIQKYCPAFPQKEWPITTRELLGHLGGIRHYKSGSQDDPEAGNTHHFDDPIAAGFQFFANDPLVAPPGTKFRYSTMGYTLVGCAIEGASGEKYVDYIRENIFVPAGMTHTRADDRFAIIHNRTRFYSQDKSGAVQNAEFLDSSYKIPGGGWLSSADDMARFEIAILNDRLVERATRDIMWAPQKAADGTTTGYALGWGTGNSLGVLDVGHSGGQQGTATMMMLVPEKRVGVIVLINSDAADAGALATDLMKLLLGTDAGQKKQ
jgi:serine beta-lactamase-like protein LACTB